MLAKLAMSNTTSASRGQVITKVVTGLMTKTLTSFTEPASIVQTSTTLDARMSWLHPSGVGITAWTLEADNSSSSSSGSCTLSKVSETTGRNLYLRIGYSGGEVSLSVSGTLSFAVAATNNTGLGFDTLVNEQVGASNQAYSIYIAIVDNAVTLMPPVFASYGVYPDGVVAGCACAFEDKTTPYGKSYSLESQMKIMTTCMHFRYGSGSFGSLTANKYNPTLNTYSGTSNSLGGLLLPANGLYTGRAANLIDNSLAMVPIIFCDYTTGYLPIDASASSGVYATSGTQVNTAALLRGGEIVSSGGNNYIVAKPVHNSTNGYSWLCRF